MNNKRTLERYYAASLLGGLCVLRLGSLMGVGALSTLRKAANHYPYCINIGEVISGWNEPEEQFGRYLDTLSQCIENSWQDYRNGLQILMLTQDEMLIWAAKIEKNLTAD